MVGEYISREVAIKTVLEKPDMTSDEKTGVVARLNAVPAADVRPVTRGRWNRYVHDKELWANYCSACNTYLPPGTDWEPNFGPNCGADMREEANHD